MKTVKSSLRLRAALIAAACLGFAGCLKDAPLVEPGRVYDAEVAVRQAHLDGLDSVALFLIDVADTSRRILIWSGNPSAKERLPAYHAVEGESFYFQVQGFTREKGLCFLETLSSEGAHVLSDSCRASRTPKLWLRDTLFLIHDFPYQPYLRLQVAGADRGSQVITFTSDSRWVKPSKSRIPLSELPADGAVPLDVDFETMPLGQSEAHIGILLDGVQEAEAHLSFGGSLARLAPLGGDTFHVGPFQNSWTGTFIQPERAPSMSSGLGWVLDLPYDKGYFVTLLSISGSLMNESDGSGPPGAKRALTVSFPIWPRAKTMRDTVQCMTLVRLADSAHLDSVCFAFAGIPSFDVIGELQGGDNDSLQDVEIRVDGDTWSARTDAEGRFRFTGIPSGDHLLRVAMDGRLSRPAKFTVDQEGWSPPMRASLPLLISMASVPAPVGGLRFGPAAAFEDAFYFTGYTAKSDHYLLRRKPTTHSLQPDFIRLQLGDYPREIYPEATDLAVTEQSAFIAFAESSLVWHVTGWESTPEYKRLRLPFKPMALRFFGSVLLAAGPDSTHTIQVAIYNPFEPRLQDVFPTGEKWHGEPRAGAGGIRIHWTGSDVNPSFETGPVTPLLRCRVYLPAAGGDPARLIEVPLGSPGTRSTVIPIASEVSDYRDGMVADPSGATRALRVYDGLTGFRDSIAAPFGIRNHSETGFGEQVRNVDQVLGEMAAVIDDRWNLRFIERVGGFVHGPFPLPTHDPIRNVIGGGGGQWMALVSERSAWLVQF